MQKILVVNSIIVTLGLALFSYWLFLDAVVNPPLTFNNDPLNYEIDKQVYKRGENVNVYVDFCKNREATGRTTWRLVDTVQFFFPEKTSSAAPGCYEGWLTIATIPQVVATGTYHLEGTGYVSINPLKEVQYEYKTEQFLIQ